MTTPAPTQDAPAVDERKSADEAANAAAPTSGTRDVAVAPSSAPATPKRINVAVNPETITALQLVIEREGVTLTEAVRRLIGYGEVLYRATKVEQAELQIKTATETKQVIIL
ncbi:hypothetical protein VA596_05460 [Amycolatopsis sp., V23-08]|uniref:Uncharacterized protein n=1 Tax=Amycolatopsis heterodermiae TaxID=3110235 RepID=A0ABU5QZR6_9PSEU|nr:hypothetical protein [Amycolatopsis sp., V23-08]MEA5358974.1 hypothetical protein [Amycolatopsis sp., V23-08]